jgi:hypothetical protein
MISDADGLCGSQGCCGAGARALLTQQARRQLEGGLRVELGKLADLLSNRAKRFDGNYQHGTTLQHVSAAAGTYNFAFSP